MREIGRNSWGICNLSRALYCSGLRFVWRLGPPFDNGGEHRKPAVVGDLENVSLVTHSWMEIPPTPLLEVERTMQSG